MKSNKSLLKTCCFELGDSKEICQHHIELLNLGLKFLPSNKKLPFIDIVYATELCALCLEKGGKIENAGLLQIITN